MRISDWSSDVCSSDLILVEQHDIFCAPRQDRVGGELDAGLVVGGIEIDVQLGQFAADENQGNAGLDDRRPGGRALLYGRRDETVEPGSQRPVDGVPLDRKSTRLKSSH